VRFLVDERLHASLVDVAVAHGHLASHVTWLGLSGEPDRNIVRRAVADDMTLVTNNARDFRRLYAREPLHAGLVIVVPQVTPVRQRILFDALLGESRGEEQFVNEVIELEVDSGEVVISRYSLPSSEGD
jgi:predicted nuclease of predicted toxin-antitoxin system